MFEVKNTKAPLLLSSTVLDARLAEMSQWCQANCNGAWVIDDVNNARFDLPIDAKQFSAFFWEPSISFDV